MIVLGLGTSLGDRLDNLRRALSTIKKIAGLTVSKVSPVYMSDAMLPEDAPLDWDLPYLNIALRCETTLAPTELLKKLKTIETEMGRHDAARWAPRVIDIDILAWGNEIINDGTLSIPHRGLLERPFALWPLADIAPFWQCPKEGKTASELITVWGSRFTGDAPFHTRQIYQRIDTPILMGIVNVTPDSFSDGGKYLIAEAAAEQAICLVNAGAEIIDIGAESTAPTKTPLTSDEEWSRLEPVLLAIQQAKKHFLLPPKISVDTRHADVARKALAYQIDWLNDVTGFQDPDMVKVAVDSGKECVVMHHVSIPASKDKVLPRNVDVVKYIFDWAEKRFADLERQGIARDKLIFDPGIGFGKTPEQSLELIKHISVFSALGTRILVGHARKSFMANWTHYPAPQRDIETLAISLFLSQQPVDFLRVHDVEMCARGLRVTQSLYSS